MPSVAELLTLSIVLALTTSSSAVGDINNNNNNHERKVHTRKLRRGSRQVTHIDNLDIKKNGLEEDVEFWTNMVRKTQYMSLPPVPTPSNPPFSSSLPPVSSTEVPGPIPSLPPMALSQPPVTSSLPPIASEPPVMSSLPPVITSDPPIASSGPPIGTSSPPIPAPIPSLPPAVLSEPPVISSSPPVSGGDGGGGFICPDASLVGCTAVDPSNPEDECPTVGEPCADGIDGEYCCVDACPRNYCTAKQAPIMTSSAHMSNVEPFVAPLPSDF